MSVFLINKVRPYDQIHCINGKFQKAIQREKVSDVRTHQKCYSVQNIVFLKKETQL